MSDLSEQTTKLVVGLGNPGRRYEKTRHNVGFRVVDLLAERWQATGRSAHDGMIYDARPVRPAEAPQRVLMLKPHTFMNESGRAVAGMMRYYDVAMGDVLIVMDDIALPLAQLRARAGGSAGGHKGLADVMARLGGSEVGRLRIGIGQPPEPMAAEDYVLGRFDADEETAIQPAIRTAADAVENWIFDGLVAVMDRYNANNENKPAEPTTNGSTEPNGCDRNQGPDDGTEANV